MSGRLLACWPSPLNLFHHDPYGLYALHPSACTSANTLSKDSLAASKLFARISFSSFPLSLPHIVPPLNPPVLDLESPLADSRLRGSASPLSQLLRIGGRRGSSSVRSVVR